MIRLSICIATRNRAEYIGETLERIQAQMTEEVELVVVDGASEDGTDTVVAQRFAGKSNCRFLRLDQNGGVDLDYSRAVAMAKGEFCWLMTDDDIVKPSAVARILAGLTPSRDLIVLNGEWANADLSEVLLAKKIPIEEDLDFTSAEQDQVLATCGVMLSFIGSVVIRRSVWSERDKKAFLGTDFVHVGVIFQEPLRGNTLVIADPQVTVRYGNSQWVARGFSIWMIKWPDLIWSFDKLSEASRAKVTSRYPWKESVPLLTMKARGWYTLEEYRAYLASEEMSLITRSRILAITLFPNVFFNFCASVLAKALWRKPKGIHMELRQSPFDYRRRWGWGRSLGKREVEPSIMQSASGKN